MTATPIDPVQYFARSPLAESLLIRFHVDETNEQVEIVYDYAAEAVSRHFGRLASGEPAAPSQVRDFRRLILTDVTSITIVDSVHRPSNKAYWDSLNEEIARYPIVVEHESLAALNGRYVLAVVISRGRKYRIEFSSMLVARRLGTAIPANRPDIWKYVDVETGKGFPFDRPFAE